MDARAAAAGMSGGSGTVIYSKPNSEENFSTYIFTNFHVVSTAITVSEEWDSTLGRDIKREKRSTVYVNIFQ